MASQVIDIQINAQGAKTVILDITQISNVSRSAASAVDMLKSALAGIGAGFGIEKIRQWSDAWAQATGQIRVNTSSQEQAKAVTDQLFASSQRSRQSFTDIVQLYNRMSLGGKDLGASQQQLINVVDTVSKVLSYSHVSAQQASGTLLQLSQSFATGRVRAQEFNSVAQGAPALLQLIANHVQGAEGSIGKLRQMMLAQKLTSKEWFDAIGAAGPEAEAKFNQAAATIGQALTTLNNVMIRVFGELSEQFGAGSSINTFAQFLSANIEQVKAAVVALGAALLVAFSPTIFYAAAAAVRAFTATLLANPLTAFATILAGVLAYLYEMRDAIYPLGDGITTLGNMWTVAGGNISNAVAQIRDAISGIPKATADAQTASVEWYNSSSQVMNALGNAEQSFTYNFLRGIDTLNNGLNMFFNALLATVAGLPQLFLSVFQNIYNVVMTIIDKLTNDAAAALNKILPNSLALTDVHHSTFDNADQNPIRSYFDGIRKYAGSGDRLDTDLAGSYLKIRQDSQVAALGLFSGAGTEDPQLGKTGQAVDGLFNKVKKGKDVVKEAQDALRTLLNSIVPSEGAKYDIIKGNETISNALKYHLITPDQAQSYRGKLVDHYQDQADPYGKTLRDLRDETMLLGFNNDARKTEAYLQQQVNQFKKEGLPLSETQKKQLRDLYDYYTNLNDAMQQYNEIYGQTTGAIRKSRLDVDAAYTALTRGDITGEVYSNKLVDAKADKSDANLKAGSYGADDIITSSVRRARGAYSSIGSGLSETFGDTLKAFDDGFADSISKAIMGAESLGDALKKVATDGVGTLITSLVKLGEQYLLTQAMGAWLPGLGGLMGHAQGGYVQPLATGGYTGNLPARTVAGIVHGGEYVLDAGTTSRLGVDTLDAISKGGTPVMPVATGGAVGASVSIGDVYVMNPTVTDGKADKASMDRLNKQLEEQVNKAVQTIITRQQRPGGTLYGTGK